MVCSSLMAKHIHLERTVSFSNFYEQMNLPGEELVLSLLLIYLSGGGLGAVQGWNIQILLDVTKRGNRF